MPAFEIRIRNAIFVAFAAAIVLLELSWGINSQSPPPANTVIFGQSAPFTGPTKALGIELHDGLQAAFMENPVVRFSDSIQLSNKDDYYEPEPALNNTKMFYNNGAVGMVGSVGTPTAKYLIDYIEEKQFPFIGPFTGAKFLRKPFRREVINVRASYIDETAAQVNFTYHHLNKRQHSIFYQADAFGDEGKLGLELALKEKGLEIVSEGTYERNTENVEEGINSIFADANPEVIVMIGTAAPVAKAAILATKRNPNVIITSVSFVGDLRNLLAGENVNMYVSQVVPNPEELSRPVIASYSAAMTAEFGSGFTPSFVSLEGYITGRLLISVMNDVPPGKNITRDSLLNSLFTTAIHNIDGIKLGPYGDTCKYADDTLCECNQGMRQVYMSKVSNDRKISTVVDENGDDVLFQFATCGYEHEPYEGDNAQLILLSILIPLLLLGFVLCSLLCFVTLIFTLFIRRRINKLRRMRLIPRGEVTICFTDIQSSTRLWNSLEDSVMHKCIQIHDKILKEVMRKHNGIFVKAIGDSLMLSFNTPLQCAEFAMESQKRLLDALWPEELLSNENGNVVLSDDGEVLFRGLRVRVGFSHGFCTLSVDSKTGQVDYFSSTVNTASRLEAAGNGGQILTDLSTFLHFKERFRALGRHKILGQYSFKGFEEPKTVVQLIDPELKREFGDLRVERANQKEDLSSAGGSTASPASPETRRIFVGSGSKSKPVQETVHQEKMTTAAAPRSPLVRPTQLWDDD